VIDITRTFLDGKPSLQDKYGNKDGNLRDYHLAQNALYLINEQYKGRKIIFWGATYHFAKNLRQTDTLETRHSYRNTVTMADVLSAADQKFYSMGFTTYKGSFGMPWTETPRPIKPASVGSFEHWANGKGMRYGFLNLTTPGKFLMRPLGHTEMMANWSNILNGVIFIAEMRPVTPK
jgi:erythromycin esterase-like protein